MILPSGNLANQRSRFLNTNSFQTNQSWWVYIGEFSLFLRSRIFLKVPRDMQKLPQKCQKITWCSEFAAYSSPPQIISKPVHNFFGEHKCTTHVGTHNCQLRRPTTNLDTRAHQPLQLAWPSVPAFSSWLWCASAWSFAPFFCRSQMHDVFHHAWRLIEQVYHRSWCLNRKVSPACVASCKQKAECL